MHKGLRARLGVFPLLLCSCLLLFVGSSCKKEKVGVLFMLHGGMDTNNTQSIWDSSMQQFSYDPNHPANSVIHSSAMWGIVFQQEMAKKYLLKYAFEYPRIGGTDPFREISMQQMKDMQKKLIAQGWMHGFNFVFDWAF